MESNSNSDIESEASSESETDEDFSDDSDEEDMEFESDEDEYDPEGPESDDDNNGCCHWSVTKDSVPNIVVPDEVLNEFGSANYDNDNDAKPHEIVETILSDAFIDDCIDATIYHGRNDPNFQKRLGNLEKNEKGRAFIRGFLAIKWHISLVRYGNKRWAWSNDPLLAQNEVKKIMTYKTFQTISKHFCVNSYENLPPKNDPSYHPLQNILSGVEMLRKNSIALWKSGHRLCIDEGRITSIGKRNKFKIRNEDKSIRMGWTVYKLGERGQNGGYFISNHLVKVGINHTQIPAMEKCITSLSN